MIKRILVMGVFALVAGAVVRFLTAPVPAAALSSPTRGISTRIDGTPMALPTADPAAHGQWQLAWTRATPALESLSLSPDGSTVAWVDRSGSVRRILGKNGATVYQSTPLPGVNYVTAAPDGCVIAASRLNPVKPTVRIFDASANAPAHTTLYPVDGAVWTISVSQKGDEAMVGTGHSHLELIPLVKAVVKPVPGANTFPAPAVKPVQMSDGGIPESIDIATNNPVAIVGTWQQSGVCAWNLSGKMLWQHEGTEPNRTYEVHLSADGSTAVAISSKQPAGDDACIHVWDARTGRLIWRQDLEAFDAHVLVSATGDSIAVSFAQQTDGDKSASDTPGTVDRKVVLFDRLGHRKFADKGGMFFSPQLVALSRDGSRITVRDNAGYIWTLDDQGRMLSRVRLSLDPTTGSSPTIKDALASDDASTLLIRRGDGQISLFRSTSR